MLELTVIICTHNPRVDYLSRVLAALRSQTLPLDRWELLVIDNASKEPVDPRFDIAWHPQGRHVLEEELGLTPARLRGITESKSELLVYVDDDNILDSDYLQVAAQIAQDRPYIGAFGGQIEPEFDETPPGWTKPYWGMLSNRNVDRDVWSNVLRDNPAAPWGAGLCVRHSVAACYLDNCRRNPVRRNLDRKGADLTSGGDEDLAYTACDIALGLGLFQRLKLKHLIPPQRLEKEYLLKLAESLQFSSIIFRSIRGEQATIEPKSQSKGKRVLNWLRYIKLSPREKQFHRARRRGTKRGLQTLSLCNTER